MTSNVVLVEEAVNRRKVALMRWIFEVSQRGRVTDQATLRVRPFRPLMRQQVEPLKVAGIEKSHDVECTTPQNQVHISHSR